MNGSQNREEEKKSKVGLASLRNSASCLTSHRGGSAEPPRFSSSGFSKSDWSSDQEDEKNSINVLRMRCVILYLSCPPFGDRQD